MKPCTTIVTFDGRRSIAMLHRKVVPDSSRTVPDEAEGRRKPPTEKEVVKEVVESSLDDDGL